MTPTTRHLFARAACWLPALLYAGGSEAATALFTNAASFQAATVTDKLVTFEGIGSGPVGQVLTTSGVTITSLAGATAQHAVYIAPAGNTFFGVPNSTAVLTANGDENFRIARQDGAGFSSIGFDFYTNPYGAPAFSLFDSSNVLIDKFSVAQTPSTLGFIGFTSTVPIAYMTTVVDQGWRVDTGIDNLRVGPPAAVPEPQTAGLMLAGLIAVGASLGGLRRSR